MAGCDTCNKVKPIPECISTETFALTGFTFPNHDTQTLTARVRNMATGKIYYIDFTTDGAGTPNINIASLFPLPDHPFEAHFMADDGTPADYLITNPDATTVTGCCLEFGVYRGLTAATTWQVITQQCAV